MDRPTIFLSSTIYDFRDLRGALKDYLEERGCKVLASEFNDFQKPPDKHSYEACLSAIEHSDLFILFIGSRVGGWFDEPNKISITRAEYRHAYELAKAGKLKILTFVRDEVWNHRQSVKELRKALKRDAKLQDEAQYLVANHATGFATDPATIISFIDEVSRNRETSAAVKGQGPLPVANWIYTFKAFGDVRHAIDPLIFSGRSIASAAGRRALQAQLVSMLKAIVPKISGKPLVPEGAIRRISETLNLTTGNLTGTVRLDGKTWTMFVMLAMTAGRPRPEISHLTQTLTSDLLLVYDPKTTSFQESPEYVLLAEVVSIASDLNRAPVEAMSELLKYGRSVGGDVREVPAHVLASHLHRLFRVADLANLAKALCLALEGEPWEQPRPMPRSPFLDSEADLKAEELSIEDIRGWIGLKPATAPVPAPPVQPTGRVAKTTALKRGKAKPPKNRATKRSGPSSARPRKRDKVK